MAIIIRLLSTIKSDVTAGLYSEYIPFYGFTCASSVSDKARVVLHSLQISRQSV